MQNPNTATILLENFKTVSFEAAQTTHLPFKLSYELLI